MEVRIVMKEKGKQGEGEVGHQSSLRSVVKFWFCRDAG